MWVSNPLEGYRIPSSAAVHCWSALSKNLDGPQSQGLSGARRQSDGEPPPRCTGPWLSPTHHRWVCRSPGGPTGDHNTIQMYGGVQPISIIEGKFTRIPQACRPITSAPGGR
ncbi:hypothetical protein WMY93_030207 [Mugilogobius chulae]|uniref:Uncharacterized protein n=1 Tax=Mugilogobius chulae TaxID=88201 RepID=A0AAW0MTV4_9GOBI